MTGPVSFWPRVASTSVTDGHGSVTVALPEGAPVAAGMVVAPDGAVEVVAGTAFGLDPHAVISTAHRTRAPEVDSSGERDLPGRPNTLTDPPMPGRRPRGSDDRPPRGPRATADRPPGIRGGSSSPRTMRARPCSPSGPPRRGSSPLRWVAGGSNPSLPVGSHGSAVSLRATRRRTPAPDPRRDASGR